MIAGVATCLAIALAVGGMAFNLGGTGQIASVAVLPFENSTGDSSIDYLSNGISEGLINKLSSLNGVRVISRSSSFSFKGKEMDAIAIGRKLGVDAIILGSLAQRGTSLAIRAELVRVANQSQIWGEKYDRLADDVLKIEAEMATTIAATITKTLRRTLSEDEKTKLTRASTDNPEAYRLYLKGHDFRVGSQREMDKSIDYFQQAIAVAPNYALAHAGLAQAYAQYAFLRAAGRAETAEKARAAVDRALALDPDLAEAHNALGTIRFYLDWDWSGAEIEFKRALALNASSATIRGDYGYFLTVAGHLDAGLAQLEAAVKLDPHAVRPLHDLGINAWARDDLDLAAARFRRALEIEPKWAWGYIKLSRVLALQKKCPAALVQAQKGEAIIADGAAPLARAWIGATYGTCGDVTRARQKLAELQALEKKQYLDPATFADIHASLGELDQAFEYFEKAIADRTPNMVHARFHTKVVPALATSPRYKALIERLAFPK